MSVAYKAGVAVGIFVAITIFVLLMKIVNKDRKLKTEYDEKQLAVRGIGYKYGFFTIIFYDLAIVVISAMGIKIPMIPEMVLFTGVMLGAIVMASYDIWHDAYMGLNTNAKGFAVFAVIVAGINLLSALFNWKDLAIYEEGVLQFPFMNLVCCFAFVLIGIQLFAKSIKDKKEIEEEED
ncbi:MAG: hypothetical protein IK078_09085 [Lachnospiraceae bacterium]|nr:hypothetical protein [Lachnospiraceae bacterium]